MRVHGGLHAGWMDANCMATCTSCMPCKEGDHECYMSNRMAAGFVVFNEYEQAALQRLKDAASKRI